MIPYFAFDVWYLGPLPIQVWGLLVAIGIIAATLIFHHLARRASLSGELAVDFAIWAIAGGLLGARVGHILFYEPSYYFSHLSEVIKIWHGGASSLGGFIGATLAGYLFLHRRKITLKAFLPYLDLGVLSFWLGWGIGRMGCFLIHDHPGQLNDFFLAVNFPGGARLDLGLLESLTAFLLFTICFLVYKKRKDINRGSLFIYSILGYAIARFFLDFLRTTDLSNADTRLWFLTPAQWGMTIITILLTVYLIFSKIRQSLKDT